MRLQCEHSTAPFFVGFMHQRPVNGYRNDQLSDHALVARKVLNVCQRSFDKSMFAYSKEVGVGLRGSGKDWYCAVCERSMAWRAR